MKKKAKRTKKEASNKTRIELRFDTDVAERVQSLADQIGISLNQLMQGLARWATQNAIVGEPHRDEEGNVRNRTQEGSVWFGMEAKYIEAWELQQADSRNEYTEGEWSRSELWGCLDFTERRVVRDDLE